MVHWLASRVRRGSGAPGGAGLHARGDPLRCIVAGLPGPRRGKWLSDTRLATPAPWGRFDTFTKRARCAAVRPTVDQQRAGVSVERHKPCHWNNRLSAPRQNDPWRRLADEAAARCHSALPGPSCLISMAWDGCLLRPTRALGLPKATPDCPPYSPLAMIMVRLSAARVRRHYLAKLAIRWRREVFGVWPGIGRASTVSLLHNLTIAKRNTPFVQFGSGLSTAVKHE